MKLKTLLFMSATLLMILSMVACHQKSKSKNAETINDSSVNKNLNLLFEKYWDKNAKLFPVEATANGDNRFNDQLPNDQTQAFRD